MDLVAGPQGGGKSTFFPVADRGFDAFNIDDRRRALNRGSSHDIPADVRARATADYEAFIGDHIAQRRSFAIEVTLANEATFRQAARARKAGFSIRLTFIAAAVEESVERVAARVAGGGHGVSAEVIRQTHARSLRNLARALADSTSCTSTTTPAARDWTTIHRSSCPVWS
jgi:predicted ABC-type ATPase